MAKKKDIVESEQVALFEEIRPELPPVEEEKKNSLYDIINAIFCNPKFISELTNESARQNIFMTMRILGIQYPDKINYFNIPKTNPLDILKYLTISLYMGKDSRPPQWIYTSGKKAAAEKKNVYFTESEIKEYIKYADITRKDFNDMMRFMPEQTIQKVTERIEYMKKINSNKND